MCGVPRALGCIACLSVWREVGALCVERLVVFCFLIYSRHSIDVFNKCFPVSQDSFLGPVTGLFWGKRNFGRACDRVGIAAMLDSCSFIFGNISSRSFSRRFLPSRSYAGPRFLLHKAIHDHAEFAWALRSYITAWPLPISAGSPYKNHLAGSLSSTNLGQRILCTVSYGTGHFMHLDLRDS